MSRILLPLILLCVLVVPAMAADVLFGWDPYTAVPSASFRLWRRTATTAPAPLPLVIPPGSVTATDSTGQPGTQYWWSVTALTATPGSESPRSNEVTLTIPLLPVTNVTCTMTLPTTLTPGTLTIVTCQ